MYMALYHFHFLAISGKKSIENETVVAYVTAYVPIESVAHAHCPESTHAVSQCRPTWCLVGGSGFRLSNSGFRIYSLKFSVSGLRGWGSGFRI